MDMLRYFLGALAIDIASGEPILIEAKTTILATGGVGQLFRTNTNALINTGDGMAMALHSGRLAGLFTSRYLEGRMSKEDMISGYEKEWKTMMGSRLKWGGMIQSLMESPGWSRLAYYGLRTFPTLLPAIISKTHGRIKYREDVV